MKLFKIIQAGLISLILGICSTMAFAMHNSGFELEGNAVQDSVILPPDDWETLYNDYLDDIGGDALPQLGGQDVFTFKSEQADITIFGGGNKDIHDVSEWSWVDGAVPDKSDILDAYAAAYTDSGELEIYFGADRFANAGDTFLGFWFFKTDVGAVLDPEDPNFGSFYGTHVNGDVLVLVNFPQAANAQPEIQVIEWDDSCSKADSNSPANGQCAAKNLRLINGAVGANAICGSGAENPYVCAISNAEGGPNDPTTAPWPYTSKDGLSGMFPYETFFEGGINLTQLIPVSDGCFASFMAETRSSSSFTAQLKDFITGAFPLCGFEVTKYCEADLDQTDTVVTVSFSGEVENTGVTDLTVYLTDTAPGSATTQFNAFCIDTAGDGCDGGDTVVTNAGTAISPEIVVGAQQTVRYEGSYTTTDIDLANLNFSDTVTADAYSFSGVLIDSKSDTANCFAANPTIDVTKFCSASLVNNDTYEATLTGAISNTGNVPLTNIMLNDVADDGSGITPSSWVVQYADESNFVLGVDELAVGAVVFYSGSLQKTDDTDHADTITALGDYYDQQVLVETVEDSASVATCALSPVQSLALTKECTDYEGYNPDGVSLVAHEGALAVAITNLITFTNDGNSVDHEDLIVLLSDTQAETMTIEFKPDGSDITCTGVTCSGRLDVGESVVIEASYLPDASIDPIIDQGTATFSNTARVDYYGVLTQGDPQEKTATATCLLCN